MVVILHWPSGSNTVKPFMTDQLVNHVPQPLFWVSKKPFRPGRYSLSGKIFCSELVLVVHGYDSGCTPQAMVVKPQPW